MNEGGNNDCFIWKNNQEWSFLNSDNLVRSAEKFVVDKLPDPNKVDTCQPPTTVEEMSKGKKRSASDQKEDGKEIGKAKSGDGAGGERGESYHDIHIWTERERRKKMRNMFASLHSLLPNLPAKADKSTIVDEAVNKIKALQNTLQNLKKQKLQRDLGIASRMNPSIITSQKFVSYGGIMREKFLADQGSTSNSAAITPNNNIPTASNFKSWASPNVIINVVGEDAHISVCCPKKIGLFYYVCYVLDKYNISMVSAQISNNQHRNLFMIQAHANGGNSLEALPVEEIYKKAANEIMLWTSST